MNAKVVFLILLRFSAAKGIRSLMKAGVLVIRVKNKKK